MAPNFPVPPSGVWCPAVTLFDPQTDTVDFAAQARYFSYLGKQTGLAGLVVLGTNAETFLLTRDERRRLLALAREVLGPDYPIMAGVGGHSTAQVVREFIEDAVEAAARLEWVLVLPPGYFGAAASGRPEVVDGFYSDVARACAEKGVGVVVYNFPGVCGGVDLDRYGSLIFLLFCYVPSRPFTRPELCHDSPSSASEVLTKHCQRDYRETHQETRQHRGCQAHLRECSQDHPAGGRVSAREVRRVRGPERLSGRWPRRRERRVHCRVRKRVPKDRGRRV